MGEGAEVLTSRALRGEVGGDIVVDCPVWEDAAGRGVARDIWGVRADGCLC